MKRSGVEGKAPSMQSVYLLHSSRLNQHDDVLCQSEGAASLTAARPSMLGESFAEHDEDQGRMKGMLFR